MELKLDIAKKINDLIGKDKIIEAVELSSKYRILKQINKEILIKYVNKVGNDNAQLYQLKLCMEIIKILIKEAKEEIKYRKPSFLIEDEKASSTSDSGCC